MPARLLLTALLASLLAGCGPGGARSDGVPTADAPFTLTALDVGHPTLPIRCTAGTQTYDQRIALELKAA